MLHVLSVEYRGGHRLRLTFSDGVEGEADLGRALDGPVFAPLRDPVAFAAVRLDPELRTVAWPNGADFAPEFLRELVMSGVAAA
ncbi:MAG TPA: DUF2442 domain-containing protein [Gemmatimonadaceae bacterium]|jgi:hypothetical protein|nr:DUF2442 domain-containing protein [Gemmatimonadaceae bacterium]